MEASKWNGPLSPLNGQKQDFRSILRVLPKTCLGVKQGFRLGHKDLQARRDDSPEIVPGVDG